ncbi:hypothetical protein BKA70DRAFT_1263184 [Coprinopsis sp. MPI-PUGE-AT-0042]|nr:hypothetical protein BKA70DRAFT_1263184 [Coprinopsis sp. MPI-PUGE-AT-0042]
MYRFFTTSKSRNRTQSPKLPLEILYKIVDEVYAAQYNTGAGNPLKPLSRTCRALAIYCRPLAFRSLAIHCFPPGTRYSAYRALTAGIPVATTKTFKKLISQNARLFDAVVHLHLDIRTKYPCTRSFPLDIDYFPKKGWLLLFGQDFSRLKSLKLSFRELQFHPDDVISAMLQSLSQARCVESLTLEAVGDFATPVLDFVPVNVKDLAIDHRGLGSNRRQPSLVIERACQPRLDSLTLISGWMHDAVDAANTTGQILPVDLTNLQHLQLPRPLSVFETVYEEFSRALILPSSRTLRCMHVNYPSRRDGGHDVLPPILRLGEYTLPNLRCLEVCAEWDRSTLQQVLTWLSSSVLTPTSALSSQALKISVLTTLGGSREAVIEHFVLWEEMCLEDGWPNLRLASVAAYAALDASEFPEHAFVDVVPLGVYGGGEAEEYHTLWESCPCSGWRSK